METQNSSSNVGVDQERIINPSDVIKDYVCSICQCLFWKPRACAQCQNILCEQCIQTWQNISDRCPFGCDSYRDQRPPPIILSALSRLKVRCHYESLGCHEIILYDRLEQHEHHECLFRPSSLKQFFSIRYLRDLMATLRRKFPVESWKNYCLEQLRSASVRQLFFFYFVCYIAFLTLWNCIPTRISTSLPFLSLLYYRRFIKSSPNQCQSESMFSSIITSIQYSAIGVCGIYVWINWMPYTLVGLVLMAMSFLTKQRFI